MAACCAHRVAAVPLRVVRSPSVVGGCGSELEDGARALCIGTGGMAEVIAAETKTIQRVEPDLTLHGLRIIWQRQKR